MTYAAVKKLALQLPLRERLNLAKALWASVLPMREPLTLAELEHRIDEIESGKVKAISSADFEKRMKRLEKTLFSKRSKKPSALPNSDVNFC